MPSWYWPWTHTSAPRVSDAFLEQLPHGHLVLAINSDFHGEILPPATPRTIDAMYPFHSKHRRTWFPLGQNCAHSPTSGSFPSAAPTRGFACCSLGWTCPGQSDVKGQLRPGLDYSGLISSQLTMRFPARSWDSPCSGSQGRMEGRWEGEGGCGGSTACHVYLPTCMCISLTICQGAGEV